jgi:RNA polymerase sigma factor (sigma-70 family)
MSEDGNTSVLVEDCLARLAAGDKDAWDALMTHAFNRLLRQCERIIGQELSRPNPLVTANSVLAEAYRRLATAMANSKVHPTTAREFFGLSARNIRWQIKDMLRKPVEKGADTRCLAGLAEGPGAATEVADRETWGLFWEAVDSLPDAEREVFDLMYVHGFSQYEAADILGKTRNQVDGQWRKVKIALAKVCKHLQPFAG